MSPELSAGGQTDDKKLELQQFDSVDAGIGINEALQNDSQNSLR